MKKFIHILTILGMILWTGCFGLFWLFYIAKTGDLVNTTNQYASTGATIGIMMGTGFLGFVWFIGFVAMGLIALITKTSKADKLAEQIKLMNQVNQNQATPQPPQSTQAVSANPVGLSELRS